MKVVILGGGISGISAAKVCLKFGHEVIVVEKEEKLGGLMAKIANCRVGFQTFFDEIKNERKLKIILGKNLVHCEKKNGTFFLRLDDNTEIEAQKVIVAVGLSPCEPEIKGKKILSSLEYDKLIDQRNASLPCDLKKVAFILCANSRNREYPLCSSVCCSYTLRQIKWTLMRATPEITVFYNDLRLFGQEFFLESALREANVRFLRTNSKNIEEINGKVKVRYFLYGKIREEEFDYVVMTVALKPSLELAKISKILGFSLNSYGFIKEAHPLETDVQGIYACGGCLEPMSIKDCILTGFAAGYLASTQKRPRNEDKIFWVEPKFPNFFSDSGNNIVFYLGTTDLYSKMFYEYSSFKFLQFALKLKERGKNVFFVTKNLITPSYDEILYEEARRKGVIFIHLEDGEDVLIDGGNLKITGPREIEIKSDKIFLMDDFISSFYDLEILGFFRSESQLRWSPTRWDRKRYHVGFARYPREKRWEMREYYAACSEIFLDSFEIKTPVVIEDRCSGCGTCKESCTEKAIDLIKREKYMPMFGPQLSTKEQIAQIKKEICLGCGLCASSCPSLAIEI